MSLDKRSVILVEPAGKGGICHYTYNLCQSLCKTERVILLTATDYELFSLPRGFQLAPLLNKFRTRFGNILEALRILLLKGRVIHIQLSQYPHVIMVLMGFLRLFGKKILVTAHNVVSHEEGRGTFLVFSVIYHLAHGIIVHAENNKKEMLDLFDIDPGRIHVIPHGNYMFFDQVDEGDDGTREKRKEKTILFFGYIRRYKGLMDIIRAMPGILEQVPEARLIIAGKPVEDFGEYEEEIRRLGIEDKVHKDLDYIPFERVREYFQTAGVVAMPYIKIYQSGIVQLACAFGVPAVATDTGGLSEVIEDGKSGFIIPVGDVKMLAEKTAAILRDESLSERMGKRARELAETAFSWDEIALRTAGTYRKI